MSDLNQIETGVLIHVLTDALREVGELSGTDCQKIDLYADVEKLVPAIKSLKNKLDAAKGEIKILEAVSERIENDMKEKFDDMQSSLVAFVMYKCGRKTLVIDSREILDATKFGSQAVTVTALDAFSTQYQVRPVKSGKNE